MNPNLPQSEGRKPGRPVGAVANPHNLVIKDLRETLRLQAELREMIRGQIEVAKQELKTVDISKRIVAIEALAGAMDTLTKSMQQTLKYFLAGDNRDSTSSSANVEEKRQKLLDQILGRSK